MRRKSSFIPVLILMICMDTACGKKEDENVLINYSEMSSMSDEEKEQKYMEYLADVVKEALAGQAGINDIDIEINSDADIWSVNVIIDYSDSLSDVAEMNQSIEEALAKFFPEGTKLSVDAG